MGAATGEPIKVGAILSLTGTYAGLGEPEKNLIEMEVEKINDAGGINGQAVFAAAAPEAGVEIVADETLNPGDTDMTAQLTKIKNSDAEAIVMWTAGAEAAIIAKNAMDLGIDLPIYGEKPGMFPGYAYDALYLVVEAAKRVEGDLTPQALLEQIQATTGWVGIDGTYTMTAEDHNGLSAEDLQMFEISGGKFVPAQ